MKSDIRNDILKSIKRVKHKNKEFTNEINLPTSSFLPSPISNFINNEVGEYRPPSFDVFNNQYNGDDGAGLTSMISDVLRGIDVLGLFRQLYNAALPLLNVGARLGLGIGVDVFDKKDASDTSFQSLTIHDQSLRRSDFIPELNHWFRRTIWFLGFSAIWTLSPSLAIITVTESQSGSYLLKFGSKIIK